MLDTDWYYITKKISGARSQVIFIPSDWGFKRKEPVEVEILTMEREDTQKFRIKYNVAYNASKPSIGIPKSWGLKQNEMVTLRMRRRMDDL